MTHQSCQLQTQLKFINIDVILKHIPQKALAVIQNDLLYSKKQVKLPDDKDRRDQHTTNDVNADNRTDDNLD